jgi:cytochrome-b5 reductase
VSPIFVRVADATLHLETEPILPTRDLTGQTFVQERELIVTPDGDLVAKSLGPGNRLEVPRAVGRKVAGADGKSQRDFIKMDEHNHNPLGGTASSPITREELAQHNLREDCWTVIKGKVYDITKYTPYHPGGDILLTAAGSDGTTLFMEYHPWVNAEALIGKYQVGYLVPS